MSRPEEEPPTDAESFSAVTGADLRAIEDLRRYRDLLEAGSQRMNLVGPSALAMFWSRHAFDSAQLAPLLGSARVVADIGTGAGFPGIVLAILLRDRADAHVHLVESLGKRCAFLREVVGTLELPASVSHGRAETLRPMPNLQAVVARACAPLPRLLSYAEPLMRSGARGIFLKGRTAEAELQEARKTWDLSAELVQSRSDPSGRIVVVERLSRG